MPYSEFRFWVITIGLHNAVNLARGNNIPGDIIVEYTKMVLEGIE